MQEEFTFYETLFAAISLVVMNGVIVLTIWFAVASDFYVGKGAKQRSREVQTNRWRAGV
ncbi:hypothetical protein [Lujinxingia vulgaris]|uniref:hypothetical protein n=1 Tax=Lujinxingia vulgaris TaxID=2600176 RepID=UPI001E2E6B56|nr:hypothetical protein [Lujinxingia vulgaris]